MTDLSSAQDSNVGAMDGDRRLASQTLRQVNELLEAQSKRIAHAVHDEAGQLLAAVFVRLEQAARDLPPTCLTCFTEIREMLEQIEQQLRNLSHELRPSILDDLGLLPALESLCDRTSKRWGIAVDLTGAIQNRLPGAIETVIYRVVQESLTNAAKHARAKGITVALADDDVVSCSIHDDGVGFDLNEVLARTGARGLGLLGIRERVESVGGNLRITSLPGHGTKVQVKIPVRG